MIGIDGGNDDTPGGDAYLEVKSEDEGQEASNGLPGSFHAFHVTRYRNLVRLLAA